MLFNSEKKWQTYITEESIIIINVEDGVKRLLFYTVNIDDFTQVLKNKIAYDKYIIEAVGKEPDIFSDCFIKAGFKILIRQKRLSSYNAAFCFNPDSPAYKFPLLEKDFTASVDDVPDIHSSLHTVFNTEISHIETLEDIKESVKKGDYFIMRNEDGEISSLINIKVLPKSFYINHIFNLSEKSIIHGMLKQRLKKYTENGGRYIYCWAEEDNIASVKFHEKYGLIHDGLWNTIYCNYK